jgi:ADP-dependent NAD(P)H-hydrate dehydratase / NAD(P)H-hydrate epimerase
MKVLNAAQMRACDQRATSEFGVPSLTLMENAGAATAHLSVIRYGAKAAGRAVILCGKGNNGGDGLVAARRIKEKVAEASPVVLLFATPDAVKGDAAVNLVRWQKAGGTLRVVTDAAAWQREREAIAAAPLVMDALLGTGLSGRVEGLLRAVIEDVNFLCRPARVLALDIPSGMSSDSGNSPGPCIRAGATLAFAAPKVGELLPPNCDFVGKLSVAEIAIPASVLDDNPDLKAQWATPGDFAALPLEREASGHKGSYGHVLVIAGSLGKTGAAAMAGWAALRSGAGLVTVATPESCLSTVASFYPELMTEPLPETDAHTISMHSFNYGRLDSLLAGKTAVALGPGISSFSETQEFVHAILRDCSLPIILDADGLNAFTRRIQQLRSRRWANLVLTPHPGELARMFGRSTEEVQQRRLESAVEAALTSGATVILKGYRTILATPDGRAWFHGPGNPGMATGGTGDALTGILAGLTAQFGTDDWPRVLSLGIYLHGLAGDRAAEEQGQEGMTATDLIRHIGPAFQRLKQDARADAAARTGLRIRS